MRWFWIDRFTEFVRSQHAAAIKNIALDEEVVDEYQRGFPVLPPTLIVEGMAQLGGLLVSDHFRFEKRVVLAKVGRATFYAPARTGDQLAYRATIQQLHDTGATVSGTSHCDGNLQAEIDLMFAFLDEDKFIEGPLFNPRDLSSMLRMMGMYNNAVDCDGNSITMPEHI
ncbi:MAG: 3-hydroxyacyl-ACP dehydratase FabZ family protein [Planctomycetota bacterium]